MLRVDTPGRDLHEAMRIPRWVRQNKILVAVPSNAAHYSPCVYILAAGVTKYPIGKISVHRRYFLSPPSGSMNAAMKRALHDSQSYFNVMNIPSQLTEAMFSIQLASIKVMIIIIIQGSRRRFAELNNVRRFPLYRDAASDYGRAQSAHVKRNDDARAAWTSAIAHNTI